MSNTLTNLIPDLYAGLDLVSRERAGFIPAVGRDARADRAAVGQSVRYHIAPPANVSSISPAMTIPEPTGQSIGSDTISITRAEAAEFGWAGEEQRGLDNNGPGYLSVQADMFAQGLRALVNEIESDLAVAAVAGASRAHGTPGDPVFASNINDVSQLRKILIDNGAPDSDLQLVVDTTGGASLRTLYGINTDRDWSNSPFNQQGVLVTPHGLSIRETGQGQSHSAGSADGAVTDAEGYAVGSTSITIDGDSNASGAILAGDVVQFGTDPNQYVVVSGVADVNAGGTLVIQEPGLRREIGAEAVSVSIVDDGESSPSSDYGARGVAFYRNAIVLASRAPALPQEGDSAADRMLMTDPRSGMVFEVSVYPGYRKVRLEVAAAWGQKVTQPRHTALLIG